MNSQAVCRRVQKRGTRAGWGEVFLVRGARTPLHTEQEVNSRKILMQVFDHFTPLRFLGLGKLKEKVLGDIFLGIILSHFSPACSKRAVNAGLCQCGPGYTGGGGYFIIVIVMELDILIF